jgi:hypothetical protein
MGDDLIPAMEQLAERLNARASAKAHAATSYAEARDDVWLMLEAAAALNAVAARLRELAAAAKP